MDSPEAWTDEDYAALRRYTLRLEREAQIRRLDELHETRLANGQDAAMSDSAEADDGD